MWVVHVPLFRDPHSTCARCRGRKCSSDVTCGICKEWSVAQWEAFLKKRSYSRHRKSFPSGSSLLAPPFWLLPSLYATANSPIASASSEAGRRSPSLQPSSCPSEGKGVAEGSGGVSCVGACGASPPPSFSRAGGGGGGGGLSWLLVASVAQLLLPSCGGGGGELLSLLTLRSQLCSFALLLPRSTPLPRLRPIPDHALTRLGALTMAAPTLALPGPPCRMTGRPGMSVVVPARGLLVRMAVLTSRSPAPRAVRGLVDACTLAGPLHAPLLPMNGLTGPGCGLRTTTGAVAFARPLGVTACGLDENTRICPASAGPTVVVLALVGTGPGLSSPLPGHGRGAGSQGRAVGIVQRLMMSPRIEATLGLVQVLPLWLLAARAFVT